jgi:hypothetical protein
MPQLKEPAVDRPAAARTVLPLPFPDRVHPAAWLALSAGILILDLLTGPYIQVAILFVFPVALATWSQGRLAGSVLAVALPLVRLPFFYYVWHVPSTWALEAADTAVDVAVLVALAWVIDYIARQRRELHVLEGMLPICGFCKRIRDESGGWRQLERYIAERSEAQFSHTFCPDCGKKQYGEYVK